MVAKNLTKGIIPAIWLRTRKPRQSAVYERSGVQPPFTDCEQCLPQLIEEKLLWALTIGKWRVKGDPAMTVALLAIDGLEWMPGQKKKRAR
jgi:hypothetical protein